MKKNMNSLKRKIVEFLIYLLIDTQFIISSIYIIPQCTSSNDHIIYRLRIWKECLFGKASESNTIPTLTVLYTPPHIIS